MKLATTFLAIALAFGASAQNKYTTSPVGLIASPKQYTLEGLTPSAVVVEFEVEDVDFKAGEYARYAQKYLGVRAKLMDHKSINVTSSSLKLAPEDYFVDQECNNKISGAERVSTSVTDATQELPVDRYSATVLPLEQAASAAAAQIFKIRATRRDLISGDIGEGVFGAGLTTALATFESTERSLVELFMGRETRTVTKYRYVVTLEPKRMQYVVCRYDKSRGIVAASDLSAEPVYLQITLSNTELNSFKQAGEKESNRVTFRVANMSKCDLFVSGAVVASEILPLIIYGKDIDVVGLKK